MELVVFTDGSYISNKNIAGYGVYFMGGEIDNLACPFKLAPLTNQRAELYAIYKAVSCIASKLTFEKVKSVQIYTDSEYSIKSLTVWLPGWRKNNWKTASNKPVKNLDILLKIDTLLTKHKGKIKFTHVRSHTGKADLISKGNEIVDKLAKLGAYKNIEK